MLFNFEPPATEDEVRAAALQYVRKVSGTTKPSKANEATFRTYCSAAASISSSVAGGSKLFSTRMFLHMTSTMPGPRKNVAPPRYGAGQLTDDGTEQPAWRGWQPGAAMR